MKILFTICQENLMTYAHDELALTPQDNIIFSPKLPSRNLKITQLILSLIFFGFIYGQGNLYWGNGPVANLDFWMCC